MSLNVSIAKRNKAALRSLGSIAPRTLERVQENHPDHRVFSDQGMPFPCPSNGVMRSYNDIDFRNTKPKDLPEGMMPMKKNPNYPGTHASGPLGKSKWDFQYMSSGQSIAVRIGYPRGHELYLSEFRRIRKVGMGMWRYQKGRGYIDQGFLVQTSDEDISVGKLRNGDDILAPHIVFWRIDGTKLEKNLDYQGN